jgi:hypothetical protein
MWNMTIKPFFFAEKIIRGSSYLDILQLYAFPAARRAASFEWRISRPLDRTKLSNRLASTFP